MHNEIIAKLQKIYFFNQPSNRVARSLANKLAIRLGLITKNYHVTLRGARFLRPKSSLKSFRQAQALHARNAKA